MKRLFAILLIAIPVGAQQLSLLYQQIARPALARVATVKDTVLDWSGLHFLLASGHLVLGAPVEGHVTTAVFTGLGVIQVLPPNAVERQQMLRFLGRSQINGNFTQAVFRFADADAFLRGLRPGPPFSAAGSGGDADHVLEDRVKAEEKSGSPSVARILQALDAAPAAPSRLFSAEVKTHDGGWITLQFDPALPEPLRVSATVEVPNGDPVNEIWTQFAPEGEAVPAAPPHLDHYVLDFQIPGNLDLEASARFTVAGSGGRGLLLGLDSRLRVADVSAGGAAADWVQPERGDWLYLRLPTPLSSQPQTLSVRYHGKDVLVRAATDHDWVSPLAWYPVPPFGWPSEPANFELHGTADKKYRLLATPTATPQRAVGFALGEDQQTEKKLVLANGQPLDLTVAAPSHDASEALTPLAGTKLVDIFDFMGAYFGPYPHAAVGLAASGADTTFPLPGVVVLDPRSFLALSPDLTELSPALSAAGQWWGAWTAPASPHDEWLVQGLRGASGLLYQESRYGREASLETIRAWRQFLLTRDRRSGHIPEQVGPLWLGAARLDSSRDSGLDLLLAKGGYGIYMLRQMMLDPRGPAPDAAFIAMMRDFTASCGGRDVTTAEFQAVVEKHMTAAMDLDHNHKMDWFFRPLVLGTEVPQLRFHAESAAPVQGVAQVALTVENPQHWRGLLPVYLFKDETTWVRGLMPITHDHETLTVSAPFQPQYVEANHFDDMLVEVKQAAGG